MHKLPLLLFASCLSPVLLAQNIVTAPSNAGSVSVSSRAVDYRYVLGGSPRTGFYHYWRQYTDQTTGASNTTPLNGSSDLQATVGTFYQPFYGALAIGLNSFVNSPTQASYDLVLAVETVFAPLLAAHQGAAVSALASNHFDFTISGTTTVTLDVGGSTQASVQLVDVLANEAIFAASGTGHFSDTLDPGIYRVTASVAASAAADTQTGTSSNPGTSLSYTIVHLGVTPGS
jgi:hypothetical protein